MSAQNVSLTAMFGWIGAAGRMLKSDWRRFVAAAFWMLLVVLVPIAIFMGLFFAFGVFPPGQGKTPFGPDMTWFWLSYSVLIVLSLVLQPPLLAGWFGLCGDVDVGRSGRGRDIFVPFRNRELWIRSLTVTLIALAIGVLLFCVTLLPFLSGLIAFQTEMAGYQAAAMAGAQVQPPMPPLGFFVGYFFFLIAACALQVVSLLALAEVAARPTSAWSALALAFRAVLSNFFKLVLFGICASMLLSAVMMIVILPLVLLGVALAFISPVLTAIVVGVGYLAMIALMYPLMFIGQYLMWKSLMTDPTQAPLMAVDA